MKKLTLIILISIFTIGMLPAAANATLQADHDSVRRMLTIPDNQNFDAWDQDSLVDVLIEIIANDPVDAMYHERVVSSALKVLGSTNVPEAVPVLIENIDTYTTACLYWLGTYGEPDAVNTIVEFLDNDDESVSCEAAAALGTIPIAENMSGIEVDEEFMTSISLAIIVLETRLDVETDPDVVIALNKALEHLL